MNRWIINKKKSYVWYKRNKTLHMQDVMLQKNHYWLHLLIINPIYQGLTPYISNQIYIYNYTIYKYTNIQYTYSTFLFMIYLPAWTCFILYSHYYAARTMLSSGCINYHSLFSCKSIARSAPCLGLHPKEEEGSIFIWGKCERAQMLLTRAALFLSPWIFIQNNNSAEDGVGVFYMFSGNPSLLEISTKVLLAKWKGDWPPERCTNAYLEHWLIPERMKRGDMLELQTN